VTPRGAARSRRLWSLGVPALAAASLGLPGAALAHVDVLPARVTQGEATELTIRVPTEREVATVRVRVDFPPEFTVYSLATPPPGWRLRERRSPDGRLVGVVYEGRGAPERYVAFTLLATPFEGGDTVWRSFQTYADGVVKPWTGPPEVPGTATPESGPRDPGPAAGVAVVAAGDAGTAAAAAPSSRGDGDEGAPVWFALATLAIALLALAAAAYLWVTRPVRLPEDDAAPDEEA